MARQLNVSARQVQVWFQNKRQRERKISRSLGLFSTPGLPDTPAATAAKVAADTPGQPGSDGGEDGEGSTGSASSDSGDSAAPPAVGGNGAPTSSLGISAMAKRSGVPMTRAVSCPVKDNGAYPVAPTSLDDTQIPLGLDLISLGRRGCSDATTNNSDDTSPSGSNSCMADLGSLSSMAWLASLQGAYPEQAKQAELHCRAAVAAARAAMDGNTATMSNASLALMANMGLRLPVLQALMPPLTRDHNGALPTHNFDLLQGGYGDCMDELSEELEDQLQAEFLGEAGRLPELSETTLTADALLDQFEPPPLYRVRSNGSGVSSGSTSRRQPHGRPWGSPFIKKRAVTRDPHTSLPGVPMSRSGVSGLLDDMNLDLSQTGDTRDSEPSATSMDTNFDASHSGRQLTSAEASMQAAADEYVQVITSAMAPFQIVFASAAWMSLCEFESQADVIGQTLEIIEGPLTQRNRGEQLLGAIRTGQPCSLNMTHHTRSGKPFSHDVRLEPLRDSTGKLHCYQATSSNIVLLDAHGVYC